MLKSNCVKEKCRFYDDVSECAIDCCMYGASVEDEERERGCFMFVDLKKLPDKALENLKSEIECAIVRAEVDENISKYRKFKDDLDEVEVEMKMRK